MIVRSKPYKVIAILVALGLLTSSFAAPVKVASRAQAGSLDAVSTLAEPVLSAVGLSQTEPARPQLAPENDPYQPDALANPLSISRHQSSYRPADTISNTLLITFTVTNNRPPIAAPPVPYSATISDTVAALATYDPADDPNTIRDILLVDDLTTDATYLDARPIPSSDGGVFAWSLGDIPPLSTVTATVTVQVPSSVSGFVDLDVGAAAYGVLQGRPVAAAVAPATLVDDAIGDWLIWTVDADITDFYMLNQAGSLGMDPTSLFDYARTLEYESYSGSLRGTRGTLWSAAGNSLDQSSLLIAMLRASGIPTRYRHGTLTTALAQDLILSMFPDPTQILGQVPAGAELADPANDPQLLAETMDHWWVEAYLPGLGWTDLDPSFAEAAIGQRFVASGATATDGTDRIAEIPDSERHKVTLQLRVEQYASFSIYTQRPSISYPLTVTFSAVELVGNPLTFGHLVDTRTIGGLAFGAVEHTYSPYLALADRNQLYLGDTYQDLLTNFPFGTAFTTGAWLEIQARDNQGNVKRQEREIFDLIGPQGRINGGTIQLPPMGSGSPPAVSTFDMLTILVASSDIPEPVLNEVQQEFIDRYQAGVEEYDLIAQLAGQGGGASPDELATVAGSSALLRKAVEARQGATTLTFSAAYEAATRNLAEQFQVRSYADRPLLILADTDVGATEPVTATFRLDIFDNDHRDLAAPGQATDALLAYRATSGVLESTLEGYILEQATGGPALSTAAIFRAAAEQNIEPQLLVASNAQALPALPLPEDVKARVQADLDAGYGVVIPSRMVLFDGGQHTGWWRIDPQTGDVVGLLENGQHGVAINYNLLIDSALFFLAFAVLGLGISAFVAFAETLIQAFSCLITNNPDVASFLNNWVTTGLDILGAMGAATEIAKGKALALDTKSGKAFAMVGLISGLALGKTLFGKWSAGSQCNPPPSPPPSPFSGLVQVAAVAANPPASVPLPTFYLADLSGRPEPPITSTTQAVISQPATHAGNALSADLTTGGSFMGGPGTASWSGSADLGFSFVALSAATATLYDPDGAVLDSGAIDVVTLAGPAEGQMQGSNLNVSLSLTDTAHLASYAPALSGLGAGGNSASYDAQVSAGLPYTLTLEHVEIVVDGSNVYQGAFTAVVNGASQLNGPGQGPLPQFAAAMTTQLQAGQLMVGPAAGTVTVNGQPVNPANGLALADLDGTATLSESGAAADRVQLTATGSFFALGLSAYTSTVPSGTPAAFDAAIEANFADTYTLTVAAPDGWHVTADSSGAISAVAPAGAVPGDYTLLVTAQSGDYRRLFASATHVVTLLAFQGMEFSVRPDEAVSVPMGPVRDPAQILSGRRGHVNNGQAEIPDAAYTINITNTSTVSHTFDVTVSGLPAGWTVLSGAGGATNRTLALPAGGIGRLGLYVAPSQPNLLPPGSAYPFSVTATAQGNPSLSQTANLLFTMPGVAFPYLEASPAIRYVGPGESADFELDITNVGNSGGALPVTVTMSLAPLFFTPLSPTLVTSAVTFTTPFLVAGDSVTTTVSLTTTGTTAGDQYVISAESPTGLYRPSASFELFVVSRYSGPILTAANQAAGTCNLDGGGLAAALESLALSLSDLELSCDAGACSLALRDRVVDAANSVADYAGAASPLITQDDVLRSLAASLASRTSDPDIIADIAALSAAATGLGAEDCDIAGHAPEARLTPLNEAALPGQTVTFTLDVSNQGTVTTTYAVTVTEPGNTTTFLDTIAPGNTDSSLWPVSAGSLGLYTVQAEAVAVGLPKVFDQASARLNVVDKFVQLTAVAADPPFVDTGVSSTDLSVEVNNVANVARDVTARTTILAPGGAISYTADFSLTLLVGSPRTYFLSQVDTSGWAAGLYTITVELLDDSQALVPDGSGYGTLAVGQALSAAHAVKPALVAPGAVTVTTFITTEFLAQTILPSSGQPLAPWQLRPLLAPVRADAAEPAPLQEAVAADVAVDRQLPIAKNTDAPLTTWAITRTEDSAAAVSYTGSWTAVSNSTAARASNNDYSVSTTAGDAASFSFNGTWVAVGFATGVQNGFAEIYVDGASQGTVDLYSRSNDVKRVTLSGLVDAAHVISVTVAGLQNPFSNNDQVILDYFDTWDGTAMPGGTYEQDDARVWLSGGWVNQNDPNASGGSYYRAGQTAWFPFSGDSITFQGVSASNVEKVALYLDDNFQGYYSLADFTVHTQTVTFDGLGAGPHVLTVRSYRGQANIDTFTSPASEPATPPPAIGSFHRYEEDDLAILYNGFPFPQTATSWLSEFNDTASDHYMVRSVNAGDTAAFTFTGTTAIVGFYAERRGGYAEIFVDGISQGVVDTYRRDPTTLSFPVQNLPNASHTLTVTVLGQANPAATADDVYLDTIDVWDGTPLPDGTFEELDSRIYRSFRWSLLANAQASGGQYLQDAITSAANLWFPFSGDSITLRTMANPQGSRWTKVHIDGQPYATINLYNSTIVSRTYSFQGLGPGLHVLNLERYRGELSLDALTTPGVPPFTQTPVYTGVVRYEEDDPALLYNGVSYEQRPQSWAEQLTQAASGGYTSLSNTAGDSVSLTFDGRWVSVGFFTSNSGGQAEIFVDGASRGTVGLYSAAGDLTSFTVGNLITGTHTVSMTVLGLPDPPSVQARVYLDYIDVWDGQIMPDDVANASLVEDNGRVSYSFALSMGTSPNAINGDVVVNSAGNPDANVWYAFTGDSFTFYGFSNSSGTNLVDLYVDNQFLETVDLLYPFTPQPLAHHYDGLGAGPHVARASNNVGIRVDAFASNQPLTAYQPLAEWWESARSGGASLWGGVHAPAAVGDVTGDGAVEVVVASSNIDNSGELFLMRGDGQDAGGGDPIIWSVPFNIFNGFENVGAPAIAELDGQPGAEIVMATTDGMYAFHNDGATYWFTDTVKPHVFFGTPAVGNLDLDAEPEIVINMDNTLVVFEQDGTIAWTFNDADGLTMPLLADLTGDGLLDILFHDWADTLYLYDYNLGSPQLGWTAVFTNPLHGYGAPAVADLDADGLPEVILASETRLFAINGEDGSAQWSAVLDPGTTGGVTAADLDGDGAVELVTSSLFNGGTLYAFEADGAPKWSAAAPDSSPLNTSAADLDGDGAYEVLWNGLNQGFTIYDGRTGNILFNEPLADSATGSDVPVAADVDLDGSVEVVVPAQGGIRVFGLDGVWGPSRPLWNQLNYHITNVNDDLTVPFSEANSWQVHNTYRTQTPLLSPLPVYDVTVTHTVGINGVAVLPGTFSVPPGTSADPVYRWDYAQTWLEPVVTRTFDSLVTGLQPGESRLVAQGTEVAYTLPNGGNLLALPPLYATAAHIVAVSPPTQTVGAGGTAVFDVGLSNPAQAGDTYTLTLGGLPAGWVTLPPTATLSAQSSLTVPLTVTVPAATTPRIQPFVLYASNSVGGSDQAGASLAVIDAISVAVTPTVQTAATGAVVTYTLTLTNHEAASQTYDLAAAGFANVTLPPTTTVPANGTTSLLFTAYATAAGPNPFTVSASRPGASDGANAVLEAIGSPRVGLSLAPAVGYGGPGTPAVYTLTVSSLGDAVDTYSLTVGLPAGWGTSLSANGAAVANLSLPPGPFNSADLQLAITPDLGAVPGGYPISATAQSLSSPGISAVVTGTLHVLPRGVQVSINPEASILDPTATGMWQVTVTNTGQLADSYLLTATGIVGLSAQFSTNPVALNPGQSQVVSLSATNLEFALPTTYAFAVTAESQVDGRIKAEDQGTITFSGYEGVEANWYPASQTVTDTQQATFMLVFTNTGNISTTFQFSLEMPGLSGQLPLVQLPLAAHKTAALPLTVLAGQAGAYTITGTVSSAGGAASSDVALLQVVLTSQPPTAAAGPDQPADEGQVVSFSGSASDPEGQPLQIRWDFGDGALASGVLTPTHVYSDDGQYLVTLTVTDSQGLSDADSLTVSVANVEPTVDAGADQNAAVGQAISLAPATFSDPGSGDTHLATIDWGDGTVEPGTVDPQARTVSGSHSYAQLGLYTVLVTVTDDDGGSGSDSFRATIGRATFLPVVMSQSRHVLHLPVVLRE